MTRILGSLSTLASVAGLLVTLVVPGLAAGASLSMNTDVRYVDDYSLEVNVDGAEAAYLRDETPENMQQYRLRFYLRLTDLTMAAGDEFVLFSVYSDEGDEYFRLRIAREDSGENTLHFTAWDDQGTQYSSLAGIVLAKGWRGIEANWRAASSPGSNDGYLEVWVDGQIFPGASGLDNDQARVSAVEWGAVKRTSPTTAGAFQIDEYESRAELYIGSHPVFNDVPDGHPFQKFIIGLYNSRVTTGCGGENYCPDSSVTRAQMAVFLLRALEGDGYEPPPCEGQVFSDVPCSFWAAAWINEIHRRGITGGCTEDGLWYCPYDPTTRAQMAVFLLRAAEGDGYEPPPCKVQVFSDVPCAFWAAAWINEFHRRGITGGCAQDPLRYCPFNPTTRGQMAVFLTATFGLPVPVLQ